MKKEEKILVNENILFLKELIKSLEESCAQLESSYKNQDYDNFGKSKKFILQMQRKISEVLK